MSKLKLTSEFLDVIAGKIVEGYIQGLEMAANIASEKSRNALKDYMTTKHSVLAKLMEDHKADLEDEKEMNINKNNETVSQKKRVAKQKKK